MARDSSIIYKYYTDMREEWNRGSGLPLEKYAKL
jgi:hypothetical protein